MTGPWSKRRRWPFFFFFFPCQLSIPNQTGYIRGVQCCNRVCIWMFLVRYIVTGCIFRAPSALWQGQVLTRQRHPPIQLRSRVPPPPPHRVHYILEQKKSQKNSTSRDSNPCTTPWAWPAWVWCLTHRANSSDANGRWIFVFIPTHLPRLPTSVRFRPFFLYRPP